MRRRKGRGENEKRNEKTSGNRKHEQTNLKHQKGKKPLLKYS
jgi:hypothetical protein